MSVIRLQSFAEGRWHTSFGPAAILPCAIDGNPVAELSSAGLSPGDMLAFARRRGGPALRAMTFHDRAGLLKALAQALNTRKEELYGLSSLTGATRADSWIDIDGGIGTLFVYASKGRRELPNARFCLDGGVENLSKTGSFLGQHIYVPREGVSVQINAFNFPVWGMLEKLGPSILAGMPVIAKPASATAWLAERAARIIVESGVLPEGAFQFIAGSAGDLLNHLTSQDMVAFTGSLATSVSLQAHPNILKNAVSFTAERDSLNCSILGPDAAPGSAEFDLFIQEVTREMTVKAGQKCTAIRRVIVPQTRQEAVQDALAKRLASVTIGDPRSEKTRMGPLASLGQRLDVRAKVESLRADCDLVFGDPDQVAIAGIDAEKGAFLGPLLLAARKTETALRPHDTEAFGPVATLLAYRDLDQAVAIARQGDGSLAGSLVTADDDVARQVIFGAGAFHGRLLVLNSECAAESTGHGSPMPHLVHGGPGRAGGGEELGGIRAVFHHMQRVALQGSPAMLTAITGSFMKGAPEPPTGEHPFRLAFEDLVPGQSFHSKDRVITLADIEHFARFTGDTFYAHMDEKAVAGHPFFPGRVAHGYLLLAFAAGLFVEPERGPVLANYGLDNLRFLKPVSPGDAIRVRLTVKSLSPRHFEYGEVRWDVEISLATGETAATYELLTMNALRNSAFLAGSTAP
jgi:oxepin-CoA hydrolase/3-oxo-5,6-dehydrosuberyl-CoA semialdehyde dehydrogenase